MSLLVSAISEHVVFLINWAIYLPSIYCYCICSDVVGTIYSGVIILFTVYRPVIFASLGILQLLVVFGKKLKQVSLSCGMIATCIGFSAIVSTYTIKTVYESNEKPICNNCYCPGYTPESSFSTFSRVSVTVTLISMAPSLVVVIVTSTWSLAVFKKYFTGGDDQLNRRMLSLPFIMPITISASYILEVGIVVATGRFLLSLSLGEYFPYWIVFTHTQLLTVLRFLSRLIYPLVLVYTHIPLQQAVKGLLQQFKINNRVNPEV